MFGFGRKKKPAPPDDPLRAYDAYLEDVERQSGELRKSAATLLSVRKSLERDAAKFEAQLGGVTARIAEADGKHDGKALSVLQKDRATAERRLEETRQALAKAEADAELLMEAARDLSDKAAELRTERESARARLAVGLAVTSAMKEQVQRVDRILELDKARDEVERAFALAQVYRDDKKARS